MVELVQQLVAKASSRDPFEIARHFGIDVVRASWHPVTVGEFDHRARRVTLNTRATIDERYVLAHELGHFFLAGASETDCDRFARELTNYDATISRS